MTNGKRLFGPVTVTSSTRSCPSASQILQLASRDTSTRSSLKARHLCYCVFGQHSDFYQRLRPITRGNHPLGLETAPKTRSFANLKKCRFYKDEVRFLGCVVSAQGIKMEEERIKTVKIWLEPQSVRDIQVFIGFANFYRRFIKNFSRIATPLTSMPKTTPSASPPTSVSKEAVNPNGNGA